MPNTENLSKKEIKGVELVIKALKKKYPFITGFNITPDYENKYRFTVFIDLKINFEELSKYSGYELSDYYFKNKDSVKNRSFLALFFDSKLIGDKNSVDELVEYFANLKNQIDKDMGDFYENSLPDEFKIKNFDGGLIGDFFINIGLDGFTDDSLSEDS